MVKIERAGVKDHGVVCGLLMSFARGEGWEPEVDLDRWDRIVAELLNSDGWIFLVAREGEEPVGLAAVGFHLSLYGSREQARLAALSVEEAYRRRGTGTKLMEEVLRSVRRRGCRELEAALDPGKRELAGFFDKFNFTGRLELLTWPCEE